MKAASCPQKILPVSGTEDRILGGDEPCCFGLGIRVGCCRSHQTQHLVAMGSKKIFDRQQPRAVERVETPEQASVFSPPNLYFGLIMAESPGKPWHDLYEAVPDRLLLEYGVDYLCDLERQ